MHLNSFLSLPSSYGYHHNPHHPQHQQFYFSKPRYEVYPYSQEDIPAVRNTYSKPDPHTTVEIQQSQGYEIKEVQQEYPSYGQNYVRFPGHSSGGGGGGGGAHLQSHEEVPVIVLKVPGPSKYAAHLKTLLQQYLEIRAEQVIRELEQQEHAAAQLHAEQYQQHQQQFQHHQAQQYRQQQSHYIHQQQAPQQGLQTHVQYATPSSVEVDHQQDFPQQFQHQGHVVSTVQSIVDSSDAHHQGQGHAVYGAPSQVTAAPEEHPVDFLQGEYQPTAGRNVYEEHQTHYVQQQESGQGDHQEYYQQQEHVYQDQHQHQQQQEQEYHQQQGHIMYVTGEPQHQQQHVEEEQQYIYPTPEQQHEQQPQLHNPHPTPSGAVEVHHNGAAGGEESHLQTPENYPDENHTRVVFTKNFQSRRPHQRHPHHQAAAHQLAIAAAAVAATPEPEHAPERFRGPIYLPTPGPSEDYGHQEEAHLQQYQQQQQQHQEGLVDEEEHHHHHHQHLHQLGQEQEEYDAQAMATPGPFITITQKRKQSRVPFNYHAHGRLSTPPPRKRETPYTEDQFNKFNKLVNRLKKKQTMVAMERTKKSAADQVSQKAQQEVRKTH